MRNCLILIVLALALVPLIVTAAPQSEDAIETTFRRCGLR